SLAPLSFHSIATPPTDIYTLSLHDALPISGQNFVSSPTQRDRDDHFDLRLDHNIGTKDELGLRYSFGDRTLFEPFSASSLVAEADRKSTRLNSSHVAISYAVFCLKKKNNK